ncbi:MAG: hypothetical protein Q7R45_05710 [Sulfuricaulis sp.]|nr:hypothetical protein [Sulfuricaulis sp.]
MALLTHVTFRVSGARDELAAFDARLKLLFAEQQMGGDIEDRHADEVLHYDLKVEGGIPFPPFALASREFPDLEISVEWVNPDAGTRGTARIVRGTLAEQNMDNVSGAAGADHALTIKLNANGYLALALAVLRTGRGEYRGYALTGRQDALFRVVRDPASGAIDLFTTQGAAEWSRAWRVPPGGAPEYRELNPAQPIPDGEFRELEKLTQDFVAGWIWFGNGPDDEIAIEVERYQRLGYAISDANLRSSALHRIKGDAGNGGGVLHYSTLDAESVWVEEAIARCWPGGGEQ